MEHHHSPFLILGAGAMGSAAAYQLAKRGETVTLLEQFAVGHDRGSSHGSARITRHSYADLFYARLMPEAFRAWRQLEADAGENFYLRTGGVSFGPPDGDYVAQVAESLQAIGVPFRRMSGRQLNRAFPAFQARDDSDVVFEPDAGILAAGRIVRAQVALAKELGGDRTTLVENCRVSRIDLEGDRPAVITNEGVFTAERLIVTAGAWTPTLVPDWPVVLTPTRQQVLYFRPADPTLFQPGRFPVFIYKGVEDIDAFYGMPEYDGCGVKAARHHGPATDPDRPDTVVGEAYQGLIRDFLAGCLPALAVAPIERTEVCLYTVAPEEKFQIGSPAGRSDIVVASPCSGHGFKFAALIGRVLADLALQGATDVEIDTWWV
jgi:sarcosine oxidase